MTSLSRLLFLTLALLTLVRWALAAGMEVTPEETYVYQLAQHRVYLGVDGGGLGTVLVWMVRQVCPEHPLGCSAGGICVQLVAFPAGAGSC